MKKSLLCVFVFLILVGLTVSFSGTVLAESGSGSDGDGDSDSDSGGDGEDGNSGSGGGSDDDSDDDSGSDSGDDDSDEEKEDDDDSGSGSDDDKEDKFDEKKIITIVDKNGNKMKVEAEIKKEEGKSETKEVQVYFDEAGNKIKVEVKTKIKDGEVKTETKRTITSPDGVEITFKVKEEIKDGESETKNSIEVNGVGFNTKLAVKEKFEDEKSRLAVELSTGASQDIIILPDEALLIAIEELQASGITIELSENIEGEQLKAVFKARTMREGRFLGLFNSQVDLETLIDTETGEIIKTTRPWWAFMVRGADKETMCHIPDGDETKRVNLEIAIPAVKAHLAHGDSVGECIAECGDGILVEGVEACDDGNIVDGDGCDSFCQAEVVEEVPADTVEDVSAGDSLNDVGASLIG